MISFTNRIFLHLSGKYSSNKFIFNSFCSTTITENQTNKAQNQSNLSYDLYLNTFKRKEDKIESTNPLIIIHGIFGHKQNWRSIAKELQRQLDNYVFVVDMRNHGESPHSNELNYSLMASDLDEFIRTQVLTRSRFKNVFLLGHSMGGKVAAEFSLKDSQSTTPLLEKLIIEDIAPHRAAPTSINYLNYIKSLKSLELNQTRSELDKQLKKDIENDDIRAFLLTNLYKPRGGQFHWRCNLNSLELNIDNLINYKIDTNLQQKCPTLFICGKKSEYLIVERDKEEILKNFPRAEFIEIGGAGHWVHSERPAKFIKHVVEFLKEGYFIYNDEE